MKQSDIRAQFGRRVRELRATRKLSQEALAQRAGLHFTYLSQVERGRRNVSLVNIDKIGAALGVSLSALFEFDGDDKA